MDEKDYKQLIIDHIKDEITHKWYDRVVKDSILYTQLSTGEDSDKLLKQFVMREDDHMFEQRKQLTQEITSAVIKTLSDVNYKIPRSPGVTKVYEYRDNPEKQKDLENILQVFNGTKSWSDYLDSRVLDLNDTDPNAWIVIESDSTDGTERLNPYPFEVSSSEAIDFKYINNILQWLLVQNAIKYKDKDGKDKDGFKYTLYTTDSWIKFEQIDPSLIKSMMEDNVIYEFEGIYYVKISNDLYVISLGKYNTGGKVPAFRVGSNVDKFTKGETYVPTWNAAKSYLLKTIKAVSELDLATALHVFPQKISYVPQCKKCHGNGYIDNDKCPVCDGSGKEISSSTQDAITLTLPSNPTPEELVNLNNIVNYVSFDTGVPKWQDEYIDKLIVKCKEVVFNAGVFNKEDINKTATGVGANKENIYDSLYNLARFYTNTWRFGIETISNITGLNDGLTIITNVSKDLKLKTKADYLWDLKQAKDANASQSIMNNIEQDIIRVDFEDNPTMFNKHMTMAYFFPFSGKNDAEIASIISMLPDTDYDKVLWMYYSAIFREIELEMTAHLFYDELTRQKQNEIIKEYVSQKQAELESKKPQMNLDE
jgi:hypothetical protein